MSPTSPAPTNLPRVAADAPERCAASPLRPLSRPDADGQAQWFHARNWAAKDEHVGPGHAEIHERCGALPHGSEHAVHFALRLRPDRFGRATAARIPLADTPPPPVPGAFTERAFALLDRLESSIAALCPLRGAASESPPCAERTELDGFRCAVFACSRRGHGLEVEFRLWLDTRFGFARRIDYHARGLPAAAAGIATASAAGRRHYEVDAEDRWVLVQQHDRLTFWSASLALPPRGFAERRAVFAEHWSREVVV